MGVEGVCIFSGKTQIILCSTITQDAAENLQSLKKLLHNQDIKLAAEAPMKQNFKRSTIWCNMQLEELGE